MANESSERQELAQKPERNGVKEKNRNQWQEREYKAQESNQRGEMTRREAGIPDQASQALLTKLQHKHGQPLI